MPAWLTGLFQLIGLGDLLAKYLQRRADRAEGAAQQVAVDTKEEADAERKMAEAAREYRDSGTDDRLQRGEY